MDLLAAVWDVGCWGIGPQSAIFLFRLHFILLSYILLNSLRYIYRQMIVWFPNIQKAAFNFYIYDYYSLLIIFYLLPFIIIMQIPH